MAFTSCTKYAGLNGYYVMFMLKNDAGKDAGIAIACSKIHFIIFVMELRKT
jgi:hypothetical protein